MALHLSLNRNIDANSCSLAIFRSFKRSGWCNGAMPKLSVPFRSLEINSSAQLQPVCALHLSGMWFVEREHFFKSTNLLEYQAGQGNGPEDVGRNAFRRACYFVLQDNDTGMKRLEAHIMTSIPVAPKRRALGFNRHSALVYLFAIFILVDLAFAAPEKQKTEEVAASVQVPADDLLNEYACLSC